VALMALWMNARRKREKSNYRGIVSALMLGIVGLMLQGIPIDMVVVIGRVIYGWAIFQGVVRFDVLLFQLSDPESYAIDYSKVHFFQNLGVLLSSFSVGLLVDGKGLQIPFLVALMGFIITLIVYYLFFKTEMRVPTKKLANT